LTKTNEKIRAKVDEFRIEIRQKEKERFNVTENARGRQSKTSRKNFKPVG